MYWGNKKATLKQNGFLNLKHLKLILDYNFFSSGNIFEDGGSY
jgi:hypothetical protein